MRRSTVAPHGARLTGVADSRRGDQDPTGFMQEGGLCRPVRGGRRRLPSAARRRAAPSVASPRGRDPVGLLQAVLLGIVEGLTEFLPVSSTGHLTIVEKLLGLKVDDPGVTAFTAIIQVGAIIAVIVYFRRDIVRLIAAWIRGCATGTTAPTRTTGSPGT